MGNRGTAERHCSARCRMSSARGRRVRITNTPQLSNGQSPLHRRRHESSTTCCRDLGVMTTLSAPSPALPEVESKKHSVSCSRRFSPRLRTRSLERSGARLLCRRQSQHCPRRHKKMRESMCSSKNKHSESSSYSLWWNVSGNDSFVICRIAWLRQQQQQQYQNQHLLHQDHSRTF